MLALSTDLSRAFLRVIPIIFLMVMMVGFAWTGYAAKSDLRPVSAFSDIQHDDRLVVTLGKAEIFDIGGRVSDIMVADPSVVDVMALQSNRLYIVGTRLGDTNLIAVDQAGNIIRRLNIHVSIDEQTLQSSIRDLFPGDTVYARTVNNQVILTGTVSNPSNAARIEDLASRFTGEAAGIINLMNVRGEQQVMLRVKIMEASRHLFKQLGVETSIDDIGNVLGSNVGGALDVQPGLGLAGLPFITGTLNYADGSFGPLNVVIRALEEDGLVNVLAEPNLTSLSGETASFLAGGEIPVPISRDSEGNVQVAYRPFGVRLSFRPSVLSDDRISMQLRSEVSSLNQATAVEGIPGMDTRNVETTVELPSGGSLMIAGLLQSEAVKSMTTVPGIRNIPILGELFKSDNFQRSETELVVIVTPYLVRPYADREQHTPIPTREQGALAKAFAANIRRAYQARNLPEDLFEGVQPFGYILD